jgi:putative acyl-CoA dehydrogenase
MSQPRSADRETGEDFNQPPPLEGDNLFADDVPLRDALRREGGDWAEERISEC